MTDIAKMDAKNKKWGILLLGSLLVLLIFMSSRSGIALAVLYFAFLILLGIIVSFNSPWGIVYFFIDTGKVVYIKGTLIFLSIMWDASYDVWFGNFSLM